MAWFSTTRWVDNEEKSLDQIVDLIMSNNEILTNEGIVQYTNLVKIKAFDRNQVVNIDSQAINYNVVNFSMNSVNVGTSLLEETTQIIRGMIIIYSDGSKVKYIINRNYDARLLLRKLHGYTGKNEIVENKLKFNDDIFMWFVKTVFNKENEFLFADSNQNEQSLIINSIIGVRGETRGENKLSAHGDTVLNLVSTLSFILESNLLKQIILRTQYTSHENIEIRLNDKGVVAVDTEKYSGNYEDLEMVQLKAQVLLLVYLDVLPKLLQIYNNEKNNSEWDLSDKNIFFDLVESKLIEGLQDRKKQVSTEQIELLDEVEEIE